jgi:hypothetical protein
MPRERTEHDTSTYRRNRALILQGSPICHYCRRRPATEADHVIEVDRGGDSSIDNLVPSCKPCNSAKGARYLNAKNAAQIRARSAAMNANAKENETRFFDANEMTPSPILPYLATSPDQSELAGIGRVEPRLATISPDGVGSWGRVLGDMALELMGVELMDWQLLAADRMLGFDANDDLIHSSSLVSVARQNGKTTLIQALILFWLIEMPKIRGKKQTVVSTAHRLDLACLLFDEVAPILEDKFGAEVMWSYGRYQATMPDGSRWFVKAAKPSIGHGMSIDLAVVDELFDVSELALDLGLAPAQRARRSPLLAMFSTAGTEASTAMIKRREAALRAIDEARPTPALFLEWSPPPDLDPMSDEAFGWGNPALGHTLRPETIRAEREGPDRGAYLRASLNLWITVSRGWIEHGRWAQLQHSGTIPPGGVVAVEVSMDESRMFAVRAVPIEDGKTAVTVEFVAETHAELWAKLTELAKDPSIKFAFSPTIDVHAPALFERRRVVVGYGEILKYTPVVRQMIAEGRLVHDGSAMLAEHVNRAVVVKTQGSIAVSSQKSPGPIELCRTMIWASALAARPRASGKPALVVVAN